jgi:hypothetical protein
MPLCDSSVTYTRAVWPEPSPAVLRLTFVAGISEVSRFSCMKFLGVSGVFDYAGPNRNSRYRPCSCCLPRIYKDVGVRVASFRSSIAHPTYSPVYASLCHLAVSQRKTRGRADRYSLLVRILHSLLHAGLSRRTVKAIFCQLPIRLRNSTVESARNGSEFLQD